MRYVGTNYLWIEYRYPSYTIMVILYYEKKNPWLTMLTFNLYQSKENGLYRCSWFTAFYSSSTSSNSCDALSPRWLSRMIKLCSNFEVLSGTFDVCFVIKIFFMLSVRTSSYGWTRKVWRARKMRKSSSRRSREQL